MLFTTLLNEISRNNSARVVHAADCFDITDVALIDGTQSLYENETLYFGDYRQLPAGCLPPQCVLIRTAETEALTGLDSSLALADSGDLFLLVNAAKTVVDNARGQGFYGELMDCAARSRAIEPVINLAAARLGNSVVLLDADFKILAHSTVFQIEDPLWAENIRSGYCTYEFVSAVQKLDAVKNAAMTSDPVVVTCYASPLRKLSSKILQNGKLVGIVLMLEKETPISSAHMRLLPIISAAAGDAITRYAPHLIPGSTAHQKLLYNLLIGASPEDIAPLIAGLQFSPRLCALCIRQTRYLGQKHLNEVAAVLARRLPGTRFTLHEGGIAALVPLGGAPELKSEQLTVLEALAKEEHLQIGVSNMFYRPENFANRYAQARRALELFARLDAGRAVCRYVDCIFYDLLDRTGEGGSLGLYCHPALTILSLYDHENGTDLYHTLGTYLACGCSTKEAAQTLFIHRNSLNYRMERIRELTELDLADSGICFLLNMSYQIDHFLGHDL